VGVDVASWFDPGRIGAVVLSELSSVILAVAIAVIVWEACNTAIERQHARFAREGAYARAARLRTLLPMLRTALIVTILTIAGLTALRAIGVNIAPLLAGAGTVGIAVGFGLAEARPGRGHRGFPAPRNAMQVGDFVGNAAVSVNLAYGEDTDRAGEMLKEIAGEMRRETQFAAE
jgi:hypothetical protein